MPKNSFFYEGGEGRDLRSMDWANQFSLSRLIVSYSPLHQMWGVFTEKDGIGVNYCWFCSKKKVEAFDENELANGMKAGTKAIEEKRKGCG